jgi:cysteine desulfurase
MDKACVYLDYAATTPVDPRVAQEMAGCLTVDGVFANPASVHAHGRRAAEWVEQARGQVAALIKAEPAEILWTGGATEANNLAILGAARFYGRRGRHILSVATEHKSVLGPLAALAREGFQIEYLPTDEQGRVAPAGLAAALRSDTVLVSIMHVNNETGTVQDLAALAVVLAKSQALFHVDAVQSAGRLALDLGTLPVDLLSLSAHKLYGPKGVGALYVRRRPRVRLAPVLFGGEQEQGARPGTVPVHQVVGMGAAYRLAAEQGARDSAHARTLLGRLWAGLEPLGGILRNGSAEAPHILNLSFVGVHGEALAAELPRLSVATGSACTAASGSPSHVLRALGRPDALAHASLRFSCGRYSTEQDIDSAVEMIRSALLRLRALSPVWRAYREGAPLATLYKEAST